VEVNEDDVNSVLRAYNSSRGVPKVAAKLTGFSDYVIKKYWRNEGLEIYDPKFNMDVVRDIRDAHKRYGGNISLAAKELGYARSTISKYWKKDDLESNYKKLTNDEDVLTKIVESYDKFEGVALTAANNLGVAITTVLHYWRENDFEIKKGNSLSKKEAKEIMDAHKTYNGVASRAAKELNRDYSTIIKIWDKHNLPRTKKQKSKNA
jgi:hypothetical protein